MGQIEKKLRAKSGDTYAMGDLFEEFVLTMFPDEYFSIVFKTPHKDELSGRGTEMCGYPDYYLRDRKTGVAF